MVSKRFPAQRSHELISASEIACFAYCPEQWRLQYGLRLPPANQAALKAGVRHHRRKGLAERLAGGLIASGRLVAVIGLLALLWLLWGFR